MVVTILRADPPSLEAPAGVTLLEPGQKQQYRQMQELSTPDTPCCVLASTSGGYLAAAGEA